MNPIRIMIADDDAGMRLIMRKLVEKAGYDFRGVEVTGFSRSISVSGLAHNLKTPIMSISGCISAADTLVDECEASLSNPQVVEEDYREIYQELRDWFQKVKTASAYMSVDLENEITIYYIIDNISIISKCNKTI